MPSGLTEREIELHLRDVGPIRAHHRLGRRVRGPRQELETRGCGDACGGRDQPREDHDSGQLFLHMTELYPRGERAVNPPFVEVDTCLSASRRLSGDSSCVSQ